MDIEVLNQARDLQAQLWQKRGSCGEGGLELWGRDSQAAGPKSLPGTQQAWSPFLFHLEMAGVHPS